MNMNDIREQTVPGADGLSRRVAIGGAVAGAALAVVGRDRAQALATPTPRADGEAPNHFVLGDAEWRITCDLTASAGGPRLALDGPYGSQDLAGEAVIVEESALGRLVTGNVGAFPDQGDLWLTLLLPRFNPMGVNDEPVSFATVAILKWVISTIAGPPRTGALEEYRVVVFEGTAQLVTA